MFEEDEKDTAEGQSNDSVKEKSVKSGKSGLGSDAGDGEEGDYYSEATSRSGASAFGMDDEEDVQRDIAEFIAGQSSLQKIMFFFTELTNPFLRGFVRSQGQSSETRDHVQSQLPPSSQIKEFVQR